MFFFAFFAFLADLFSFYAFICVHLWTIKLFFLKCLDYPFLKSIVVLLFSAKRGKRNGGGLMKNRAMQYRRAAFLDVASLHPDDLDVSGLQSSVETWVWRQQAHPDDIADIIRDVEVVVSNKTVLDQEVLACAKQLKLICVAATGVNNVDIEAAARFGVAVCNARGYATPSVVQHVFMLMLMLATRVESYQRDVFAGNWSDSPFFCLLGHPVTELEGMTLGIVGYGELGQAVARLAEAFGMRVLVAARDANDTRAGRIALYDMLPMIDVLSLHCPLTEETRGLIGAAELDRMRNDAWLINTARGGLVDELALLQQLDAGKLGGAALDVLAKEPPESSHPLLQQKRDNLIITPHTAWASRQARQRLLEEIRLNIEAYQSGQSRNQVNITV